MSLNYTLDLKCNLNVDEHVIEEIALEGLDGISLESLFVRLQVRKEFHLPIDDLTKALVWEVASTNNLVRFYELDNERKTFPLELAQATNAEQWTEASILDEEIYPVLPIVTGPEIGSCSAYNTRRDVTAEVERKSLSEVIERWGNKLVIVANFQRRLRALCGTQGSPIHANEFPLKPFDFIYLEYIGRSRSRGVGTVGKGSTFQIKKDNRVWFYHVSRLSAEGYVTKYLSRQNTTHLKLTRFATPLDLAGGARQSLLQEIVDYLKTVPNRLLPRSVLYSKFTATQKMWKRALHTDAFQKRLQGCVVPYRTCYPNAPPSEYLTKMKKEKKISAIKLIGEDTPLSAPLPVINDSPDANLSQSTMDFDDDDDTDMCFDGSASILTLSECFTTQLYKAILAAGPPGINLNSLSSKLNAPKKVILVSLRTLMNSKEVIKRPEHIGRQKVFFFKMSPRELEKPVVQQLQRKLQIESGTVNVKEEGLESVKKQVSVATELVSFDDDMENLQPTKKLYRMSLIIESMKKHTMLSQTQLTNIMRKDEEMQGHQVRLDRKTVGRLLKEMTDEKIIKSVEKDDTIYYCHLSANPDVSDVLQPKWDPEPPPMVETTPQDHLLDILMEPEEKMKYLLDSEDKSVKVLKIEPFTSSPKFIRLSVLHDLLFYLVRGYTGETEQTHEQMVARLEQKMVLDEEIKNEMPRLYWDHPSCYMFIPPLTPAHQKLPGWCTFADILMKTPLSVYTKLVNSLEGSPELMSYVNHPIRCHYPISELPPHIRVGLFMARKLQSIMYNAKRLCFMGLLRLGRRNLRRVPGLITIYVNTRANILDTTISPPAYIEVDRNIVYESLPYYFHSIADVKAYWVKMFNICLETRLGRIKRQLKKIQPTRECDIEAFIEICKPVSIEEAEKLDDGTIPGDHLGAGGLDSKFFSFTRSNWIVAGPKQKFPPSVRNLKRKISRQKLRAKKLKLRPIETIVDATDVFANRKLRVSWSPKEDNFLVLLKAAITFLHHPGDSVKLKVPWPSVRSALRRHVGKIAYDKTQAVVRRRLNRLFKDGRMNIIPDLVKLFRRTPEIVKFQMDDSFGADVKPKTPEFNELVNALAENFRGLMDFLAEKYLADGVVLEVQEEEIPDTLEELSKIYDLSEPPPLKLTTSKIKEDAVRALSLSSLVSSQTASMFEMYQQFEETLLRTTMDRLHKQCIVTIRKCHEQLTTGFLPATQSRYRFTQRFALLLNTKYHQSIYHDAHLELNKLLCCPVHSSIQLNLKSCGPAVFPLACLGYVNLSNVIPDQFVTLNAKYISAETGEKIMRRYRQIINSEDPEAAIKQVKGLKKRRPSFSSDLEEDEPPAKKICEENPENENAFLESLLNPPMDLDDNDVIGEPSTSNLPSFNDTPDDMSLAEEADETKMDITDSGFPTTLSETLKDDRSANVALSVLRQLAMNEIGDIQVTRSKPIDIFVVTTSKVNCSPNPELSRDYGVCDGKTVKKILYDINERLTVSTKNEAEVITAIKSTWTADEMANVDAVLALCTSKGPKGASVEDLRRLGEEVQISWALNRLLDRSLIYRLGIWEVRFVSSQFTSVWSIKSAKAIRARGKTYAPVGISERSDDSGQEKDPCHRVIMRPWLRIDGTPNRRMLDRLLGTVLGRAMLAPGCTEASIADWLHPALSAVWTSELTLLLERIGCIGRRALRKQKPTLFSKGSITVFDRVTGLETPDEIIIEAKADAIIKLGQFIGNKSYSKDILT